MNRALLALAIISALVTGARAHECTPENIDPDVDVTTPNGRYYVENDLCQTSDHNGCLISLWVYQESNDIDGLQRHDPSDSDTCGGEIPSDTIVASAYHVRPA